MKYSEFKEATKDHTAKFFDQMDVVFENPNLDNSQKVEEFVRIGEDFGMDKELISQLVVS